LESPFSVIANKLGVNLAGNQEIGGNNPPYLKSENRVKGRFNMKNNGLIKFPQQILEKIGGFHLIQKQWKVSTVSYCYKPNQLTSVKIYGCVIF
jgi:hypothetical protein